MRIVIMILTSLFMATTVLAENYVNQSGSTMTLDIAENGAISGTYTTALGCGVGIARPLVGWMNGKAVSFTVHFGACDSVTSWVGHIDDNKEIKTIWTLAKGGNSKWNTKLTGFSVFKVLK